MLGGDILEYKGEVRARNIGFKSLNSFIVHRSKVVFLLFCDVVSCSIKLVRCPEGLVLRDYGRPWVCQYLKYLQYQYFREMNTKDNQIT